MPIGTIKVATSVVMYNDLVKTYFSVPFSVDVIIYGSRKKYTLTLK